MGSSPLSLKRLLLLSAFCALRVLAQDDNDDKATPTEKQDEPAPTTDTPPPPPETSTKKEPKETTTVRVETRSTSEEKRSTTSQAPTTSKGPITPPALSTSTRSKPPLPTLSSAQAPVDTNIPEYPPPAIPPTRNAPFMNHSTLPDGTVFIAVGAILGAFGVAVLVWRGIVACLLHRSVERAAMAQHAANNGRGPVDKNAASFPAPPAQFYKYIERESSPSLAGAGVGASAARRSHRGPTPSSTPSQTNLFFSPTAAGSSSGLGGSNRDSARFLPSGFYASASPAQGHGHGNSISLSNLRPSSRGRGPLGPSPPDSPDVGPRGVGSRNFSTSSLNLNRPPSPGARAPSAYLDDLLDEQPGQFPPAGGSASPHGYGSQGRRF